MVALVLETIACTVLYPTELGRTCSLNRSTLLLWRIVLMPIAAQGLNAPLKWSGFDSAAAYFEQRLHCVYCAWCLKTLSSHLPAYWDTRMAPRARQAPLQIHPAPTMEVPVSSCWICWYLFSHRQVTQCVGYVLTRPPPQLLELVMCGIWCSAWWGADTFGGLGVCESIWGGPRSTLSCGDASCPVQ